MYIARNGVPIKCKPADPDSGIICCTIDMYAHIYIHSHCLEIYIYIISIHSHCLEMSGLEFAYLAQPSRAVHFNLRNNKCVWYCVVPFKGSSHFSEQWGPSPWPSKSLQRPGGIIFIISAQSLLQFFTSLPASSSFHLRSRDPPRPGGKGRGSRSPHDSRHETCGKRVGNVWETCGKPAELELWNAQTQGCKVFWISSLLGAASWNVKVMCCARALAVLGNWESHGKLLRSRLHEAIHDL